MRNKIRVIICGVLDSSDADEGFGPAMYSRIGRLILVVAVQSEWHARRTLQSSALQQEAMQETSYIMLRKFTNGLKCHKVLTLKRHYTG